MTPRDYLQAARVPDSLQPQEFGPWMIKRIDFRGDTVGERLLIALEVGWPSMTTLERVTEATMHLEHGEVVMDDSKKELQRHLPIWLAAHGRVLISGLGLGCVVRGLLAKPEVDHVDVIEIDQRIIDVVGLEFAMNPRVTIHHGDALAIEWQTGTRWDAAWHDIWCEGNKGLHELHVELLARYRPMVCNQGAWMLPRIAGRLARPRLLGAPRCGLNYERRINA